MLLTPVKSRGSGSTTSAAASGPGSITSACRRRPLDIGQRQQQPQPGSEHGSEQDHSEQGKRQKTLLPPDEGEKPLAVTAMSLQEPFPKGDLGTCLNRIRKTVNTCTERLSDFSFPSSVKTATIRALERRLLNHEDNVRKSMHVLMIEGSRDEAHRPVAIPACGH